MPKKILSLLLTLLLAFSLVAAVFAVDASEEAVELPMAAEETEPEQTASFYVDGEPLYGIPCQSVCGYRYVPIVMFLRAVLAECESETNGKTLTVTGTTVSGESVTLTVGAGAYYMTMNGRCIFVRTQIQAVGGWTFCAPVVTLASLFGGYAYVSDEVCYAVTGDTLLLSGDEFYDADDLDLLARLIYAEAGNQPLLGKLAVGNVVLNRVADSRFPSTIYGVIYAKNQFSVVSNGAINRSPNSESIVAAKLALEGAYQTSALYFNASGTKTWASRNRTYVTTIGNHDFYA